MVLALLPGALMSVAAADSLSTPLVAPPWVTYGLAVVGGLFLLCFLVEVMLLRGPVRVESHWGGFGGGLGGWQLSPSILYLAGAIAFVAMLVLLTYPRNPKSNTDSAPADSLHRTSGQGRGG